MTILAKTLSILFFTALAPLFALVSIANKISVDPMIGYNDEYESETAFIFAEVSAYSSIIAISLSIIFQYIAPRVIGKAKLIGKKERIFYMLLNIFNIVLLSLMLWRIGYYYYTAHYLRGIHFPT